MSVKVKSKSDFYKRMLVLHKVLEVFVSVSLQRRLCRIVAVFHALNKQQTIHVLPFFAFDLSPKLILQLAVCGSLLICATGRGLGQFPDVDPGWLSLIRIAYPELLWKTQTTNFLMVAMGALVVLILGAQFVMECSNQTESTDSRPTIISIQVQMNQERIDMILGHVINFYVVLLLYIAFTFKISSCMHV